MVLENGQRFVNMSETLTVIGDWVEYDARINDKLESVYKGVDKSNRSMIQVDEERFIDLDRNLQCRNPCDFDFALPSKDMMTKRKLEILNEEKRKLLKPVCTS